MKEILLFTLLFLLSNLSFGQFTFGMGGGSNLSFIANSNYGDYVPTSRIIGYDFYLLPGYKFNERCLFFSKIQFSGKGFSAIPPYNNYPAELKFRHSYLILNPQIELKPIKRIGLTGGFYFGRLLKENRKYAGESIFPSDYRSISSNDCGFTAGLKVYFSNFFFTSFYSKGILDLNGCGIVEVDDNLCRVRYETNESVHVGFGYLFK